MSLNSRIRKLEIKLPVTCVKLLLGIVSKRLVKGSGDE